MATKRYFLRFCIYALWWLYSSATACKVIFGFKPFVDQKCVPSASSGLSAYDSINHPKCVWRCLKMKQCRYLNYNDSSGQCELGFGQCEYLLPAPGLLVNAYGLGWDTCLHWGAGQQTGLVPVEGIARLVIGQALVVGKFLERYGKIFGNDEGTSVEVAYDETLGHGLLMSDPACTLSWLQYIPHTEIPSGAVIGGHLADGSPTYVAKVYHTRNGNNYLVPGYYNTKTGMAYAEAWGPQTSTDMMMLILLWHFEMWTHTNLISKKACIISWINFVPPLFLLAEPNHWSLKIICI